MSTRVERWIEAPPERVYEALLDADAVAAWRVPEGMSSQVHEFEPRVGGRVRVSLSYDDASGVGKTSGRTDTYSGVFTELIPGRRVVEVDEFETDDPALRGPMTMTFELTSEHGGTRLVGTHDGVPEAVSEEDNQAGWRSSLDRLAALVETR
jgi:uncharacterized protein YndB with AHSA1/START domain